MPENLPSQEEQASFQELAELRGYSPERSRDRKYKHVSHVLKCKSEKSKEPIFLRFDVKKCKNLKHNQSWLWIEFKNKSGEAGWIRGDSHFVAFERKNDFIILNRKELIEWLSAKANIRYDLPYVKLAKQSKYRIYRRPGTKEETTQVKVEDLKGLQSFKIWRKDAISKSN